MISWNPLPKTPYRFQYENKQVTSSNSAAGPKFSGATHLIAGKQWVTPETFQKLYNVYSSPYVGKIPKGLLLNPPKAVYQLCDELSAFLRPLARWKRMPVLTIITPFSDQPLTIKRVDHGSYGTVYQLVKEGESFAFKVFHEEEEVGTHGSVGENGVGLHFSDRTFKDLARFYFGNPKAGWAMMEFIADDMSCDTRSGQRIKHEKVVQGDSDKDNSIRGIRVDYGGLTKGLQLNINTIKEFDKAMETGCIEVQAAAVETIIDLPQEFRKDAFDKAMETGCTEVQAEATQRIRYLPDEFQKDAFDTAMETGCTEVQTAATQRIKYLPDEFQKDAFDTAMETNCAEVQAAAAETIIDLPQEFRKDAFDTAMETGCTEVQAAAAGTIWNLPDEFRKDAFDTAMETGYTEVQAAAAGTIWNLPNEFRKDAFDTAMETNCAEVQAAAAQRIKYLPDEFRKDAFDTAMETNCAEVQAAAAGEIEYLPDEFQKDAFDTAMETNCAEVQAAAAETIWNLPNEFQQSAFDTAMETGCTKVQAAAAGIIQYLPNEFRKDAFDNYIKHTHLETFHFFSPQVTPAIRQRNPLSHLRADRYKDKQTSSRDIAL